MLPVNASRRMAAWWIRYPDLNWPNPDNLEKVKKHAKDLADANVTTVIIFGCHFRWDWLPWFNLVHDYLATVVEECHKYGMEVFDHFSVNLVHRSSTREEFCFSMKNSGPHLPLGPSREAAATWMYNGHYLNEFRMIDTKTREPVYFPQYQGEGFCINNPDFVEAMVKYLTTLVEETKIDGLSADDPVHYLKFKTCACEHCRKGFKKISGIDLPDGDDTSFWFNYDNPAWRQWLEYRVKVGGDFIETIRKALPKDFILTTCGASSAAPLASMGMASDARSFARGINLINAEMSGNTPPYKHDPMTTNNDIPSKLAVSSHHLAVAREKGVRCFGTTYAHHPASSEICWAVNKTTGADCWISTLKQRLGLPDHILDSLPDEAELVKAPFTFEKEHEELFRGDSVPQLAVFYSEETRNGSLFGVVSKGYFADYREVLIYLAKHAISSHTVFDIPTDIEKYPLLLIVSPLLMTDKEKKALKEYLSKGGKAIICGPCALENCKNHYDYPHAAMKKADEYNTQLLGTAWTKEPAWRTTEDLDDPVEENEFSEVEKNLFYNPVRVHRHPELLEKLIVLVNHNMRKIPVVLKKQKGYLANTFDNGNSYIVHFLAADFDTDIDHELDEIRFHRSRCNLINKVEPCGIEREIVIEAKSKPVIFTPFSKEETKIEQNGNEIKITLPEKCAYAIMQFNK